MHDTMSYLLRGAEGEVLDGVADPPRVRPGGQGKQRGEWRIERDLPEMRAARAAALASPALLLSCHDARGPRRASPRTSRPPAPPQPGGGRAAPGVHASRRGA